MAEKKKVYQIKVTLKNIKPPIWRRILVTSDITLDELHDIIQIAMGWDGYHLHQFKIGNRYYGEIDPDYDDMEDESKIKLSKAASKEKAKFSYEYDFGDSWDHQILVEKILPMEAGKDYPVCTAGKRACPPEDVGGVWGYADFLEAVKDPEHEDMLEWAGGEFDPDEFDPDEINYTMYNIILLQEIFHVDLFHIIR